MHRFISPKRPATIGEDIDVPVLVSATVGNSA